MSEVEQNYSIPMLPKVIFSLATTTSTTTSTVRTSTVGTKRAASTLEITDTVCCFAKEDFVIFKDRCTFLFVFARCSRFLHHSWQVSSGNCRSDELQEGQCFSFSLNNKMTIFLKSLCLRNFFSRVLVTNSCKRLWWCMLNLVRFGRTGKGQGEERIFVFCQ